MVRNLYFLMIPSILLNIKTANAMFMPPFYTPVDRLIKNTEAFMEENPDDPHGYYLLGRIHYLAFVNKATLIGGSIGRGENGSPPDIPPNWLLEIFPYDPEGARLSARQQHAEEEISREMGDPRQWDMQKMLEEDETYGKKIEELGKRLKKQGMIWSREGANPENRDEQRS